MVSLSCIFLYQYVSQGAVSLTCSQSFSPLRPWVICGQGLYPNCVVQCMPFPKEVFRKDLVNDVSEFIEWTLGETRRKQPE